TESQRRPARAAPAARRCSRSEASRKIGLAATPPLDVARTPFVATAHSRASVWPRLDGGSTTAIRQPVRKRLAAALVYNSPEIERGRITPAPLLYVRSFERSRSRTR